MGRHAQRIHEFIASQPGIIRTSAFRQAGVGSRDLDALISAGHLIRLKTGFYIAEEQLEHLSDYQIIVQLLPDAIICFISAAALYGLTTVIPDVIHIAVPNRGKKPQTPDYPPVDIVQHTKPLYEYGRLKVQTEYGTLPVYDRERTVCDCLKRQDELGMDVVAEIIRSYIRGPKNLQKLYTTAERLHVRKRLTPYVEVLV